MWYKQAGRMSNLINYMRKLYQRIRSGEEVPEEDLIRLSKRIHNFYSTKPHSQYQIATRQYEDICSEWEKARDKRKKELERMESEQSEELNKPTETESNEPMNIAASYISTTTKKAQENIMKINSNTIGLSKESSEFSKIEDIIMKIAAVNGIKDVESVQIQLTADKGIVGFKTAEIDPATGQETGQQVDPATGQAVPGAAVAGGTAGGAGLTEADYAKVFSEAAQSLPQQAQPQATPTQQQVSPQTV